MAKNASKKLKFRPDMYCYGFYQIPEDFWKILKIFRFLAKKGHLARISRPDFAPLFFRKNVQLKKLPKKRIFETLIF